MNNRPTLFSAIIFCSVIAACAPTKAWEHPPVLSTVTYNTTGLVPPSGRMYAILIGINQPNLDYAPLTYPDEEIRTLAPFLAAQEYRVDTLTNERATRKAIFDLIDKTISNANTNDRVLMYFAGHAGTFDSIWNNLDPGHQKRIDSLEAATNETIYEEKEFFLIPYQENSRRGITELVSFHEIVQHLNADSLRSIHQRIVIVDACFGGYFVNRGLLSSDLYENEVPPDGFYALTSVKSPVADGQYFPFILKGLKGAADSLVAGNRNGKVGLYELSQYLDSMVSLHFAEDRGETYFSRYIMVGSGPTDLTVLTPKIQD